MSKIASPSGIDKTPTGIRGLDDLTLGGLPRGYPVLVCGGAGCGKTVLAMEFLVRGAQNFNEPGLFVSFEESPEKLAKNFRGIGFDLPALTKKKSIGLEYIHIERSEIEETGEYDLEALFIRLGQAVDEIGAKRIVIDTIEALFSGLTNTAVLRAELRRLFRWLSQRGLTAIITGERHDAELTRYDLEEFVADCVILLDVRVHQQVATRRMRIVKYRGSAHGTDEYPFLIDNNGVSVLPITSLGLQHTASNDRVSTGIDRLDGMLGGKGYFRGSTILVSGTAGSGKSSLASTFTNAACARGERAQYFAFEESPSQILRNMGSIGLDLNRWVKKDLLHFHSSRPAMYGLEMHLVTMHEQIKQYNPKVVVIDPISNLTSIGSPHEIKSMLTRLIDFLKMMGITALMTDLTHDGKPLESTNEEISSLIDTWLALRDVEFRGERNRGLNVIKSRGMPHSKQIREFLLTDHGISLTDVYVGPEGILMGSARAESEAKDRMSILSKTQEVERIRRERERKRRLLEIQIEGLRAQFESELNEEAAQGAAADAQMDLSSETRQQITRMKDVIYKDDAAAHKESASTKNKR